MAILRRNLNALYKTHLSSSFSIRHFSSSFASDGTETPVTIAEYLQQRHKFSPDTVSKLASPGKYLKDPKECDSVISFFKEIGFSKTHLQQMIKRHPAFLSSNVDLIIKPKIKLFQDAGLSRPQIAELISTNPRILRLGTDKIASFLSELNLVLKSRLGVFKVMKKGIHFCFVGKDLTQTMKPNLDFLVSCGIESSQIIRLVHHYPRLLVLPLDTVKKCVEKVDEMGCDRESKMFLHAIRTISSLSQEHWERKLEAYRSLGLSEDDIRSVFRRYPHVFCMSESNIKESTKVLLSARNDDISLIVNNPGLIMYSLEKTIRPRVQVLKVLERKNLLRKKPSLVTLMNLSSEAFVRMFVLPYSAEVGTIYNPGKDLAES